MLLLRAADEVSLTVACNSYESREKHISVMKFFVGVLLLDFERAIVWHLLKLDRLELIFIDQLI